VGSQHAKSAKRIKDTRYLYSETIIRGRLTVGDVVRGHRILLASRRRINKAYGGGSEYARLAGEDRAARRAGYLEQKLVEEMERFRVEREGNRGTRRKIDTICMGRNCVITEQMVIVATRNPDLRTWYL